MIRRLMCSPRVSLLLLSAVAAFAAASRPTIAHADAKVYQKLLPSTAWVVTDAGLGSGVLIDAQRRLLLTNEHVVDQRPTVLVFFPEFKDGRHIAEPKYYNENAQRLGIKGRVLLADAKRDLALVQLERVPDKVTAVPLAAASPSPGEEVHSIGNPGASGALWVYTRGNVRAVYRKRFKTRKPHEMRVVETQSPINPGDSGGPVVNAQGELIGLSQSLNVEARLVSNCVDVSEVRALMAEDVANHELLKNARLKIVRETPRSFAIELAAGGGTHMVFIARGTERFGNVQTRRVFAVARIVEGALPSEVAITLLEQNAKTKLGGWAIEATPKGKTLVLFSITADTASADKLAAAAEYVAKMAVTLKQ